MRYWILSLLMITAATGEEWTNLWPAEAPGAPRPPAGSEKVLDGGRMTDIEVPQFSVVLPEKAKATGAAVVIFPGGGYTILAMDHEGRAYAQWLAERGIAGIVVKYRVSGDDAFRYKFPVPFLDARRAIRTVRANAAKWGIDPKRVGVMGSSAGGHLASLCATRSEDRFDEEGKDAIDQENCRPDFAVLVYPVISMEPPLAHGGSRRRLLGPGPSEEFSKRCSTDQAVAKNTPPTFLLTTSDDGVDCRNSLQFAAACRANGVPAELHLFPKGGHGYGLKGPPTWPGLLEEWLKTVTHS